jgi:branched-chain amino acid transport system substrate-binding protein
MAAAEALRDLKTKRVVAFCENTDYGIGLAKGLGEQLKAAAPDIEYRYETLDRAGKDFIPALLPLKANPPDAIVEIMLPPAAYIALNQLYEQGIAPAPGRWLFDAPDVADYPDFWQNVTDAAKSMLVFSPFHPKMTMPELGKTVAAAYKAKTGYDPGRLLFQAADSLFVVAEAIKAANSTESDAMIKALENLKWTGTRGEITFSQEKRGYRYHQWIDVPAVTYQITALKQPIADARIIQDVGKPFDASQLVRPQ